MNSTRRQFIQTTMCCAAGLTLAPAQIQAALFKSKKTIPIGLQLYAVRGEFAANVPETLKMVKALGYEGVEFWGYAATPEVYQKYTAKDLRKMLDDTGLKCCGMHLAPKAIEGDNLAKTIEVNQTLGNPHLIVAANKEKMGSESAIAEFAAQLNKASQIARKQKCQVGYHAHGFDFEKVNGKVAWEMLFSQTKPDVIMQIDVGNSLGGGGDPLAMLKQFPGRATTIHLREHQDKTFESDYYKEIFKLCETTQKTKWYIVEMGGADGKGFDVTKDALVRLRKLGK